MAELINKSTTSNSYKFDIGIVIVSYNVMHFLSQTLKSIYASQFDGLDIEVWVVDNDSVDSSLDMVRTQFPQVNVIANDQNVGFSAANNQAIVKMNSKYVLLLNPDTILSEQTLILSHDYLEKHPEVGALGPRMIDGAGKFLPESKRQLPNAWNSFCKLTYLSDLFPSSKWFSGYNLGYLTENLTAEIDVLCGAFMMIPRAVLDKVGLLDDAFFMYGEDIDLSYRIQKADFKIIYFPETTIIHFKGESTKKSSLNYVKIFYGAMDIYVKKHFGESTIFSRLLSLAIFLRAAIAAIFGVGRGWIRPVLDVAFIWMGLHAIKYLWAVYHFENQFYYEGTIIGYFIIAYTFIWILGGYINGWYSAGHKRLSVAKSIAYPTIILLVIYGLLPEEMRTSRAILLFGSLWAMLVMVCNAWLATFLSKAATKSIAIVGSQDAIEHIKNTISHNQIKVEQYYYISPSDLYDPTLYINDLDHLNSLIKPLKINEVIYASSNLTTKDIIQSMTSITSPIDFRIAGDELMHIIGSQSRHMQGDSYGVNIKYNLSESHLQVGKRCIDIIASLIMFTMSPILWPIHFFKKEFWKNIFDVISAKKTWVGYGGDKKDWGFLPSLRPGVIKAPYVKRFVNPAPDFFFQGNLDYARNYTLWNDVLTIVNQSFKISQH